MVARLDPLQNDATSGAGKILTVPDPARMVYFIIRSKDTPKGEITFECCPMDTVAQYYAGSVSGMFRARIPTPVMGGTVTVWPFVGVLIGNANAALEPVVR
jgi:hypothetical protein